MQQMQIQILKTVVVMMIVSGGDGAYIIFRLPPLTALQVRS